MFKEQSLFIIVETDDVEPKILRVEMTKETQIEVCNCLSSAAMSLSKDKYFVRFNGSYKPGTDEMFVIPDFNFNRMIIEAIEKPLGIAAFIPKKETLPKIKAIFMGNYSKVDGQEKYNIAFQRFRKEQYITRVGINLFHDADSFVQEKRFGICITDTLDCIIVNGELRFNSFYYARQVFDLSNYYRQATDADVDSFINNEKICVENANVFKDNADSMVRRKIALITDSEIFTKFSAKQIIKKASYFGLKIPITNDKITFPSDKKALKNVLKFLDEEIYKGIFSEEILQTNSKRKAEF